MKAETLLHNTNQPEVVARLGVSLSYLTKFNLVIATAVASFTNSFKNLFKIYFILILLTFMESTHLRTIINPNQETHQPKYGKRPTQKRNINPFTELLYL